jgi:hypothetical protein
MSPINPFRNPNFTLEQVQNIYKEFEDDFKLTIDPEIIEDIYNQTNGYVKLVGELHKIKIWNLFLWFGFCCPCLPLWKAINSKLDENRRLSSLTWLNFIKSMQKKILDYNTFRKMVKILIEKKEAKNAVKLLWSTFLGYFGFVTISDFEKLKLAEFLTAEEVLLRDEINTDNFKMSSIFVDDLIRQQVIPVLYKSIPTSAVPLNEDNSLDTLKILQTAIQFFDKDIISNAFIKFRWVICKW